MNQIVLIRHAASAPIISGALRGQDVLAQLAREAASEPASPDAVFQDFSGI